MASARTAHSESNKSGSNEPSTYRLVIRAEIIPEETPETTVPLHSNRRSLALVVGGLVVLLALSWVGISVFRTDSASMPNQDERAQDALQLPAPVSSPSEPVPVVSAAPAQPATSTPATASAAASPSEANSVELEAKTNPDVLPSPINEVIPDVPRSALQTIRGTIRVSVRVTSTSPVPSSCHIGGSRPEPLLRAASHGCSTKVDVCAGGHGRAAKDASAIQLHARGVTARGNQCDSRHRRAIGNADT